jgi:uncharacterized membrane protein YesL
MAAIAEPIPAAPRLGGAVRAAGTDFYFNSWRMVPANLAWAAMLIGIVALGAGVSGLALLLAPALALPTAGIYRLAGLVVRGRLVSLSDGFSAWRTFGVVSAGLGTAVLVAGALLSYNLWFGLQDGGVVGIAIATLAGWGLMILAMFAAVAWPLLLDPKRDGTSPRDRLRLALLLILAHPGRCAALTVTLGLVLAVSTVAFAALITIGVSFVALVATRYVLPAADRLEAALAARQP